MSDEILEMIYDHFAGLFPRDCTTCGRRFATLRQYILETTPVGSTTSFDAQLGDWHTTEPIGAIAMANCPCGSTLGLTTEGIALPEIHRLLAWVREETTRRGMTQAELLESVRTEMRQRALDDPRMAPPEE